MSKLTPLVVVAAIAALSACGTPPPQSGGPAVTAPNIVTNMHPYTPGQGVVQSVSPTPVFTGAGAGSSAPEPTQRLEIKMDNGTIQYVDTPSRDFAKGTRVTLTEDKLIRRM
jgi:hypothetical protein